MNKYLLSSILCFALVFCCDAVSFSQIKKDEERKKEIEVARQAIWAMKLPAFENRTVPEKYANEPGVIMARYQEVKAGSKKPTGFTGLMNKSMFRETNFTTIFREQVKINDKATLDEYSEMSYQKYKKLSSFFSKRTGIVSLLGVRIIQPDGQIREVNADEEVFTKDEKHDKRSKLAISGLEVGDIIDYFIYESVIEEGYKSEPYLFLFADEKPILHSTIHCEISPAFAVEYRAMNGAPDFKTSEDADGNKVLDVSYGAVDKVPMELWMSPMRQLSLLRLRILVGSKSGKRISGEIYRNPPLDEVVNAAKGQLYADFSASQLGLVAAGLLPTVKSMIRTARKTDHLPQDSISYYTYYALRYLMFYRVGATDEISVGMARNFRSPNQSKFILLLSLILKDMAVPNEILLSTSMYGPDQKQALLDSDFQFLLRTTSGTPVFFSAEGVFTEAGYIPADLRGQPCKAVTVKAPNVNKLKIDDAGDVKLPETSAADNIQTEKISVSLTDNQQILAIDRQTIQSGLMKQATQRRLLLFEDYYEEERNALSVKKSFMEEFDDKKKTRSLTDEYASAFGRARTEQKENFSDEIENAFGKKPKELVSYKIDNMALRHGQPNFMYSTKFTMDEWLKKGGTNLILDIGNLIGEQLMLKPGQEERQVDVYMPFPRTLEYFITVKIPEGYQAEGVPDLATNISNSTGQFVSDAKIVDNEIVLHVKKVYTNTFEPVANWPHLVSMIQAANDFRSKKVLLRKI